MLKLFGLLFAIIAATQAVSDWTEQTAITDDIMDLAKWSASQLTPYTNGEDHIVMAVKNLQTQVADGMNYKFTLEVVVSTADNRYFVSILYSIRD